MNKLYDGKGNLINRAEKMKKLGVKANKQLPQGLLDRAIEE
jgi:DNA recombination protein RmuC